MPGFVFLCSHYIITQGRISIFTTSIMFHYLIYFRSQYYFCLENKHSFFSYCNYCDIYFYVSYCVHWMTTLQWNDISLQPSIFIHLCQRIVDLSNFFLITLNFLLKKYNNLKKKFRKNLCGLFNTSASNRFSPNQRVGGCVSWYVSLLGCGSNFFLFLLIHMSALVFLANVSYISRDFFLLVTRQREKVAAGK